MSTESETLERDTLEKRSRDELHTIASTLGLKMGSRARKAELVDAILESAGVTTDGARRDDAGGAAGAGGAADAGRSGDAGGAPDAGRSGGAGGAPDAGRSGGAGGAPDAGRSGGAGGAPDAGRSSDAAGGPDGHGSIVDRGGDAGGSRHSNGSNEASNGTGSEADAPVVRRRRAVGYSADPTDDAARAEAARAARARDGVGGGESGSSGGSSTGTEAGTDQPAPVGDRADGADQQDHGDQGRNEQGRSDGGRARDDQARDDQDHGGQARDEQGRSDGSQARDRQGRRGGGDDDEGQRNKGGNQDEGQRNQDGGKGGNQGGGNQGGGNQGGGNQENLGEPGNRRRRRRGRDRERNQDDGPAVEPVEVSGLLDLRDEGYGFLRTTGFLPSKDDVYVSAKQARQLGLRRGDHLSGLGRPASRSEKNPALLRIDTVNGGDPEVARSRPQFADLTPLFPDQKLRLERDDDPTNMTNRIIDLIAPIGKGQRGLIVSPPKAGKTMIIKQIAQAIETNSPECHLIVLLVDERPEEVTDMKRSIKGDVVASTFDRPSDEHTQVAELTIERAKRMVEEGIDVVIILDGITRLARAYNLAAPATGRIMSGGVDSGALYPPKRFFGAARNIEEGGSLTILATALVDTGSKMDEVIFEEFKGTGNMELRLDRRLAERRIYPAIDVDASSTRHEELLFERKQLQQVWKLRRVLSGLSGGDGDGRPGAGLELLLDRLKTFRSNDDFLAEIAKAPSM